MKSSCRFGGWLLTINCWLLSSCGSNPLDVDVSAVNIAPVKIQRFDQDFFSLTADNIRQKLPELQKKYPGFTDLFIRNILCPSGMNDSSCIPAITKFISDKDMRSAYIDCQKNYSDLSSVELSLTDVIRHHKYYFPGKIIPQFVAMMSGFNYSVATTDSVFAIALEMYLGKKNNYYEMLQVPSYRQMKMQKEFIVPDFARAWTMREFPNNSKSGTLLSEMIYQGKILYLVDALLPDMNDTLKIGFTKKQLDWCAEHESDMWGFLVKNKFLYSTQVETIAKFTGEGPFTTGFVKESPARTGVWIGWKIVRNFMKENPKISPEELMKENDAQMILSKSKYKP